MNLAVIVGLAFAPAIFWFWFFARRDRHPEPAWLLLRTFLWGGVMVLPAALLEIICEQFFAASLGVGAAAILGLVLVGPIEELAKFAAASNIAKHREFDEWIDGLVYATVASLGFATLENVFYLLEGGAGLILLRGPISTLAHILFALPWGFALAQKRFRGGAWVLRRGLLIGAGLHSLFDLLLAGGGTEGFQWLLLPFVPLMVVMWRLAGRYYAHATGDEGVPQPASPANAVLEAKRVQVDLER